MLCFVGRRGTSFLAAVVSFALLTMSSAKLGSSIDGWLGDKEWVPLNVANNERDLLSHVAADDYNELDGELGSHGEGVGGKHFLAERAPSSQSPATWGGRDSIFPLPVPPVYVGAPSSGGRRRGGRGRAARISQKSQVRDAILALNEMAHVGTQGAGYVSVSVHYRRRAATSDAQRLVIQYIERRVHAYRHCIGLLGDTGAPDFDVETALAHAGGAYHKSRTVDCVPITAKGVSLPIAGAGASVPLMPLLPPDIRSRIEDDGVIMIGPPEKTPRSAHVVAPGEYPAVIQLLLAAHMYELCDTPAIVTAGIFGVPKPPNGQRLLTDGRIPNARTGKPPPLRLPSPFALTKLACPPGMRLYMGTCDLSNYFHMLALPPELRGVFGLPGLLIDGRMQYPHALSLPMGFDWAPALAQAAHVHGLTERCVEFRDSLTISSHSVPVLLTPGIAAKGVFIDDVSTVATSVPATNHLLGAVLEHEISPVSHKKTQWAAEGEPVNSWGVQLDGVGDFRVAPVKALALHADTTALLQAVVVSVPALQNVLGRWLWVLLLVRQTLSQLDPLFKQGHRSLQSNQKRVRLSISSRAVLRRLMGLLPLLAITPSRPTGSVLASDASSYGGGVVVFHDPTPEVFWELASLAYYKGRDDLPSPEYRATLTRLLDPLLLKPRAQYGWVWSRPEDITVREARASFNSIQRAIVRGGGAKNGGSQSSSFVFG